MRIARLETITVDDFPNLVFVRVETSDGVTGLGETYYGARAVETFIQESAAARLLGQEFESPGMVPAMLTGYVGRGGSGTETRGISAIDIAVWDAFAKTSGKTLAELVADHPTRSIPVYNTCAGPEYARNLSYQQTSNWGLPSEQSRSRYEDLETAMIDAGALAMDLHTQGITAMKIWPFDSAAERTNGADISPRELEESLQPLRKIRAAAGDDMGIMIELHGLWKTPGVDRVLEALAPYHPAWVEDPVNPLDVWELARLLEETPFPIATGETLAGVHAYRHLCERRAADVVVYDAGWGGGVTTALEVADLTRQHELRLAFHDCTGPVGLAVATALACALPEVTVQEFTRAFYFGWYSELARGFPVFQEGRLRRSPQPGHGAELAPYLETRPGVRVVASTVASV